MEPILDETALLPCSKRSPATRIHELASTLQALDALGVTRVLRSVRDAADRDLGEGRGLRSWCFDRSTSKDAGRLVAGRLAAQPFIDGENGLFAEAEGRSAVEAKIGNSVTLGMGLAALTDGVGILLASDIRATGGPLEVVLTFFDESGERVERVEVQTYASAVEVTDAGAELVRRFDRSLNDGTMIVERIGQIFPNLVLGARARDQIADLPGTRPIFLQLVRHLRALNESASRWNEGESFELLGISFSVESKSTLDHGSFGPMRDFPTPEEFDGERFSLHTKLTGGNESRLYFRPIRVNGSGIVLIGYFGDHLPTVKYPT